MDTKTEGRIFGFLALALGLFGIAAPFKWHDIPPFFRDGALALAIIFALLVGWTLAPVGWRRGNNALRFGAVLGLGFLVVSEFIFGWLDIESSWLFLEDGAIWISRIPGLWAVAAFLFGGWAIPFASKRIGKVRLEPRVAKWLRPREALWEFCSEALIAQHKSAYDRHNELTVEIDVLERQVRESMDVEGATTSKKLADLKIDAEGALLVLSERSIACTEDLRRQLRSRSLIGKGYSPQWWLFGHKREVIIPADTWRLIDFDRSDPELRPISIFKQISYEHVMIGKVQDVTTV